MIRDMDLVRAILFAAEATPPKTVANPNIPQAHLQVEGYDDLVVTQHVEILVQANLLTATYVTADGVGNVLARNVRLTWDGHDFLDNARNDTTWRKAKAIVKKHGGAVSFDLFKTILVGVVKEQLGIGPGGS